MTNLTIQSPRLLTAVFALALGANHITLAQTSRPDVDETEFAAARAMLRDAAVRMDESGIQLARTRLEPFANVVAVRARANYIVGLADFASILAPGMSGQSGSPQDGELRINRAIETLTLAVELDPAAADAASLLSMCEFMLANKLEEPQKQELMDAATQRIEAAYEADPKNPVVTLARSFLAMMGRSDMTEGLALMEESVRQHHAEPPDPDQYELFWWGVMTRASLARMLMMSGDSRRALELVDETLAIAPTCTMVSRIRPGLLAAVAAIGDGFAPLAQSELPDLQWIPLSDDPAGDGHHDDLADGAAFAWACDEATQTAWFSFTLHGDPDPAAFGVNVIVDSDGDQATGANWWGSNRQFTWDRLVTVWLTRGADGRYTGNLGVGDVAGVRQGDFASLHRGEIKFAIQPDDKSIIIGVPWSHLTEGELINVVGAVGSNSTWNDDLQEEGYATIRCPAK